ncbi:MAG: excinuclease ABC subunit UvrC [Patescibacteria group bacterium]|nr:excinuclease ABC subunit UvrC [Patescibacteria group bacterium]MDE2015699.1 excinuclease ABC subunit UvrC [Patescibacteria group bacterium]MDE2226757.1 excinuclease ABC subunit UvrC [Patescibacteria group bacterium]
MRKKLYDKMPVTPGVYLMKDASGSILYVGKAANLRRRVSSYFERAHDARIDSLVSKIRKIEHKKTDTALEALILEAKLIKQYRPPFNIKDNDDKSFLYIEITKEKFPRVLLVRGREVKSGKGAHFGPFVSASNVREALKILRKIFPWNMHDPDRIGKFNRPCFDYEIGICPGTCTGTISRENYLQNIKNLKLFLGGCKAAVLKNMKQEMAAASKRLDFETAAKLRGRIFALQHIQDTALINESDFGNWKLEIGNSAALGEQRIEGYDISNISGTSAVGSMVVFVNGMPDKKEYRKFKIKTITQPDDVGMLKEVLRRRFHNNWTLPNIVLVDGGLGQVNAAKSVLKEFGLKLPLLGIAKGPERKRNDIIGFIPRGIEKNTLIKVRDEAHRFAVSYHKHLRGRNFIGL